MSLSDLQPDPEMTAGQFALINGLSEDEIQAIDSALLSNTRNTWRKVARVVGTTMLGLLNRVEGIPDIYYAQRVQCLVAQGLLEGQGDMSSMKFSEVRIPAGNQ